jgi:hypothetical protein
MRVAIAWGRNAYPGPTRSEAIEKHAKREEHLLSDMGARSFFWGSTS